MSAEFSKGWWLVAWTGAAVCTCAAVAMSSACLTTRRSGSTECPPDAETHCRSECDPSGVGSRDTREGRCETILNELCRAHCLETCGDHSSSLTKKIESYESSLEHDCGSGQPLGPGETPRLPVSPTPHPVDRLLREA